MRTLILLLVMCCSGQQKLQRVAKHAPCYSECGMLLEHNNKAARCEEIDEQEEIVLHYLDHEYCATDNRFCHEFACNQLFGWQIEADNAAIMVTDVKFNLPDGGSTIEIAVPVSGLSECRSKQMWLGEGDNWRNSSYAHEIIHAIEDCDGNGKESIEDRNHGSGHEGWTEDGVFNVIETLRVGAE